jgi:hypothetical protein
MIRLKKQKHTFTQTYLFLLGSVSFLMKNQVLDGILEMIYFFMMYLMDLVPSQIELLSLLTTIKWFLN